MPIPLPPNTKRILRESLEIAYREESKKAITNLNDALDADIEYLNASLLSLKGDATMKEKLVRLNQIISEHIIKLSAIETQLEDVKQGRLYTIEPTINDTNTPTSPSPE